MMKSKGKKLILGLILSLLVVLTVGLLFTSLVVSKKEKDGVADTRLFWNVEREVVDSKGIPEREREEDGYYKVLFAVDGEQIEYKVLDEKVMAAIDETDLMGLIINENDVITGTLDLNEITAGEVASYCYVEYAEEDKIVANSTLMWDGISAELSLTSGTNIYDVSRKATFVGEKINTIHTYDRIRAFKNDAGEISHIFMLGNYSSYNTEIEKGWCEHCNRNVEWALWESMDSLPVLKGHFRLTGNVFLSGEANVEQDEHVILDLNGCKVESAYGERVYNMYGDNSHLIILDQSAEQTGKLVSRGTPGGGGVIWMRAGGVDMYSGTIDASEVVTPWYGAAVQIYRNQTFNMYGGTIIGGTAQAAIPSGYEGVFGGIGAGVYVAEKATFNMYGGIIRDGKAWGYSGKDAEKTEGAGANLYVAEDGTANIEGGEILNGTSDGWAGNVWVGNNAVLTMTGGHIVGGSIVRTVAQGGYHGGNVTVAGKGTFHLLGGEIVDGISMNSGGNVALYGTMNMSGGKITDGKHVEGDKFETAKQVIVDDENMFIVNATFNMTGGQIGGHVEVVDTGLDENGKYQGCTVTLSETANISGGKQGVTIHEGDTVQFGKLKKGAEIWITGKGYVSSETAQENTSYVHSDYGVEVLYSKKCLFVGEIHCVCGGNYTTESGELVKGHYGDCDGTKAEWLPWTETKELPQEGNWYLTNNVQVTEQQGVAANAIVRLDLKGHLVQGASDCRVYNTYAGGASLIVTDTSKNKNGRILAQGGGDMAGGCIWAANKGKVSVYAGILDASEYAIQAMGASVYVEKDANFTLYGGTIIGGTVNKTIKGGWGIGGAAYVVGTFDMYGGTIRDGKCEVNGGNIAISEDGTFNLYDGEIQNGSAIQNGGNIFVAGKLNLAGGTIQSGKATECGGNIYSNGKVRIEDGVIEKGTAVSGGNIRLQEGIMTMTGGTIRYGKASAKLGQGGNVYAIRGTEFKMSGGTICDGEANYQGGNVYVWGAFSFAGGKIIGGRATNGGNVYVTSPGEDGSKVDGTMTMSGKKSVVRDGLADENGGNICVLGTFVMSDGVIKNGLANGTEESQGGGNVYADGIFRITKGLIQSQKDREDNTIQGAKYGGNVYIAGGKTTVSGSDSDTQIADGKAEKGGNIFIGAGRLEIYGGTVGGGQAKYGGGNVWAQSSDISIDGGLVKEGFAGADNWDYGQGGNVYVTNSATAEIKSGIICDGEAIYQGGNVWNAGNFTMKDGTIKSGKANNAGNVFVMYGSTMNMSGGTIEKGTAVESGGNVYILGENGAVGVLNMTGGTIAGGKANGSDVSQGGGNVYTSGTFNMTNGLIQPEKDRDGNSIQGALYGGNVYVASGTMNMGDSSNTPRILDGKATIGGNIWLYEGATLNINNATISGGYALQGGNIHLYHETSTLNMKSGTIENGVAENGNGGNICAQGNLNVTGGIIRGGKSSVADVPSGGKENIFINQFRDNSSHVVLKNCEVTGIYLRDVDGLVQINGNTKILAPKTNDGQGLVVDLETHTGTWLSMEGDYSSTSVGQIEVTATTDQIGKAVMEKGIALSDRERLKVTSGSNVQFMFEENKVTLQAATDHIHCACGGMTTIAASDCKSGHWDKKWTEVDSLNGSTKENGGYYYLSGNEVADDGTYNLDNGANVSICLSDTTYTGNERAAIMVTNGNLTLCNGTVTATGSVNKHGGCIKVDLGASVKLYDVDLDASAYTLATNEAKGSVLWCHVDSVIKAFGSSYKKGKETLSDGTVQIDTNPIYRHGTGGIAVEGLSDQDAR